MEKGRFVMVQKVGNSIAVTIPASVRRAVGIKRGDTLYCEIVADGMLVFRKINNIT